MYHAHTAEEAVKIPPIGLAGDLVIPANAGGIVLFAHGSGSSRHSPRNRYVAQLLQQGGLGTLLLDLLTEAEEQVDLQTRHLRFDIALLAGRLAEATDWLQAEPSTQHLPLGYCGASTGAGAALVAAARKPAAIGAVVSRGGRPDLAAAALPRVQTPTLLIVGGNDFQVMEWNREAMAGMRCVKKLSVIPGATHLFEEPGTLEQVSTRALEWLQHYLPQSQL